MYDFMVRLERSGKVISEVEVELECTVDCIDGEPVVMVAGIHVDGDRLPMAGTDEWAAIARLAVRQAEADPDLVNQVLDDEGWHWRGRGALDPEGEWRRAA